MRIWRGAQARSSDVKVKPEANAHERRRLQRRASRPTKRRRCRSSRSREHRRSSADCSAHGAAVARRRRRAGPGTRGPFVALLQRGSRRSATRRRRRGVYDAAHRPRRARLPQGQRDAAHHDARRRSSSIADARRGGFKVRYPEPRPPRRGEPRLQVLALIDSGRVERIYPTSSGKPSTPTVLGNFRFYIEDAGHEQPRDGLLELLHPRLRDPRLLRRADLQRQPRLPARADPGRLAIYSWVRIGDRIDVYY